MLFLRIFAHSWSSISVYFESFRKRFIVIFRVFGGNLVQKYVLPHPNTKLELWTFLDLETLDDLEPICAQWYLVMALGGVPNTIHSDLLTMFLLDTKIVPGRDNQNKLWKIRLLTDPWRPLWPKGQHNWASPDKTPRTIEAVWILWSVPVRSRCLITTH